MMRKILVAQLTAMFAAGLMGCEQKGPGRLGPRSTRRSKRPVKDSKGPARPFRKRPAIDAPSTARFTSVSCCLPGVDSMDRVRSVLAVACLAIGMPAMIHAMPGQDVPAAPEDGGQSTGR
jgi:predicted small lipoprotein YifL